MIFTKYKKNDGQITGILNVTTEEDAKLSCLPDESYVEGRGDQITQEIINGKIVFKSKEIIEFYEINQAWETLRLKRQILLANSDWTQVPDAPADQSAWASYRQALRDLPSITVDPKNPNWPTPPK